MITAMMVQEKMSLNKKKNFEGSVQIFTRKKKTGLGSAYIKGMELGLQGKYKFFLQMDADLSHQPRFIPKMLEKISNYDLIIGSRYIPNGGIENWSRIRKGISYCGNLYARIILRSKIKDLTGGFNLWRRKVLEKINFMEIISEGYTFQIELKTKALLMNFNFCEVPIIFPDRVAGKSKLDKKIVLEAIKNVWKISN